MNPRQAADRSPAAPGAEARDWPGWNAAVPVREEPGKKPADLAARISVTAGQAAGGLARAETRFAVHSPVLAVRDAELVQIHAEAGRFFQSRLPGSWVPDYLASRGLAAALLPTSPWKIGYAPFSLLCCRVSLTVLKIGRAHV
jgi:hypothetical protein